MRLAIWPLRETIAFLGGSASQDGTRYRADIDGLRALAVTAIIAFHLHLQHIDGGFVGVDIFYVISGFLIGGIVISELKRGTFSLLEFYQRRLRRILPALITVLICTTLAALVILFPSELSDYARSLLATALWTSNIYFWQTTNYFTRLAVAPLLHTWSLGVEEQYYLFFPLLTMAAFRLRAASVPAVIAIVAAASLALSVVLTNSAPMANFYLLPTRAWELLLGVLAAITPMTLLNWRPLRETVGLVGLALIVVSIFYTPERHFPGLSALPSCLGTAAIIVAGTYGRNIAGLMLSRRPVVFVGLISYSLYLWHWPIIVFILRSLPAEYLDRPAKLIAAVLTLILALLSWHFVEKPFRASKASIKRVLLCSAGAVSVLVSAATILIVSAGLPSRFDPQVAAMAALLDYNYDKPYRQHQCFLEQGDSAVDRHACLSEAAGRPNVLLIGDSNAAHLWFGLTTAFAKTNIMQATSFGCRPIISKQENGAVCDRLMDFIFNDYLIDQGPDLVILAGWWYLGDENRLAPTLDWLKEKRLRALLVGPDPDWTFPLPTLAALALQRGDPGLVGRHELSWRKDLDMRFEAVAKAHDTPYMSVYRAFCPTTCVTLGPDGLPLFWDYDHLTAEGSEFVAKQFRDPSLMR